MVGTEKGNNNADDIALPPLPIRNAIIEVSNIGLSTYDVIIYLGINSGQAYSRLGGIDFNGNGVTDLFIPGGSPSTTLDEITGAGDTGSYIRYNGVAGSSFSATIYGDGFTHMVSAGFQNLDATAEVPEPASLAMGLIVARCRH